MRRRQRRRHWKPGVPIFRAFFLEISGEQKKQRQAVMRHERSGDKFPSIGTAVQGKDEKGVYV